MPWLSFLAVGSGAARPLGTLTANLLAGFIIGIVVAVAEPLGFSPATRPPLTTGFLGGLTTFSTLSAETSSRERYCDDRQFTIQGDVDQVPK
jgi:fluoride exporter